MQIKVKLKDKTEVAKLYKTLEEYQEAQSVYPDKVNLFSYEEKFLFHIKEDTPELLKLNLKSIIRAWDR